MRDTDHRLTRELIANGEAIRRRAGELAQDRPGERLQERMSADREVARLRRDAETLKRDLARG